MLKQLSRREILSIEIKHGLKEDDLRRILEEAKTNPSVVNYKFLKEALSRTELPQVLKRLTLEEIQTIFKYIKIIKENYYQGNVVGDITDDVEYLLSCFSATELVVGDITDDVEYLLSCFSATELVAGIKTELNIRLSRFLH